jgi:hypothetical protein
MKRKINEDNSIWVRLKRSGKGNDTGLIHEYRMLNGNEMSGKKGKVE